MRVFVLDAHDIFRRGLVQCLSEQDLVGQVGQAESVREAWADPALRDVDLVIVDQSLPGSLEFIRQIRESTSAQVVACASNCTEADILTTVAAGAIGVLDRQALSRESLCAAVQAAATGAGYLDSGLLATLMGGIARASREVLEPHGISLARLSEREQQVLRLIADGHPTHEVARRMRYSERTIKSVVHDVVTKLSVRTRSQAVALAVREGLI